MRKTNNMEYPSILKRVQATFVDQVVAFALMGLLIALANEINEQAVTLKVIAIIIAASYEPLMTFTSRTIGQRLTGIRVIWISEIFPLKLVALYVRFVFKLALGWVSFITLFSNEKRRAMHDIVSGTLVISKSANYITT